MTCCMQVWFALEEKNIPYDTVLINLQNKPAWFKELVPTQLVPAVKIDGKLVYESYDIMMVSLPCALAPHCKREGLCTTLHMSGLLHTLHVSGLLHPAAHFRAVTSCSTCQGSCISLHRSGLLHHTVHVRAVVPPCSHMPKRFQAITHKVFTLPSYNTSKFTEAY